MPRKGIPKKPTKTQRRRAKYLINYLSTGSDAQARHASGLGAHAKQRIIKMLKQRASISDAPRSGRPRLYTRALMRKAVQILVEHTTVLITGRKLLGIMISMGMAHENADVGTFMRRLRDYVTSIGLKLVVNSTNTIFFLTANDIILRVQFAAHMLAELADKTPEMFIFIDETTLEEATHPKGRVAWSAVCTT